MCDFMHDRELYYADDIIKNKKKGWRPLEPILVFYFVYTVDFGFSEAHGTKKFCFLKAEFF